VLAAEQVRETLTHGLETLVSSSDRVNEQLVHALVGKQADATVKKPDHDAISPVSSIWHLI
jgi:hypothetical protein